MLLCQVFIKKKWAVSQHTLFCSQCYCIALNTVKSYICDSLQVRLDSKVCSSQPKIFQEVPSDRKHSGSQVLDGVVVEAAEQASARGKYAGRLMLDWLAERLGHRAWSRVRELELPSLGIRDVGDVFLREDFVSLTSLNLQDNEMLEVSLFFKGVICQY